MNLNTAILLIQKLIRQKLQEKEIGKVWLNFRNENPPPPDFEGPVLNFCQGYRKLALAMLVDAVNDILRPKKDSGESDARCFLSDPDRILLWGQILGLDEDYLARRFRSLL